MENDTYLSIAAPAEGIYKEKGSKFIAYAYPVSTEEEIKKHIDNLKKEHYAARHHCYAYRLGFDKKKFRANDDGEPSNSAGKPILGQLLSHDLSDILIVVVRYFGGTKLGVGGLITAYKSSAVDAIEKADICEKILTSVIEVKFEYPLMNQVMKIIKDYDLELINQLFEMDCLIKMRVRKTLEPAVLSKLEDIEGARVSIL